MAKTIFPVAEGIEMQQMHLAHWARLLKPEIMARVRAKVEATNANAKTGFDVCRGDAITEIVVNLTN